jgi:hypothetical protein
MQIRDPESGMGKIRVRDPGWKTFGSGIRDKHPGSATLIPTTVGKECCSCRVRYQREGLTGLEEELRMELTRISQRNLGRDNRMVGNELQRINQCCRSGSESNILAVSGSGSKVLNF